MKRVISIILIISTLLSCIVMTVTADESYVVSDEGRLPFEDVKDAHWFTESVRFCYVNDIIAGMNDYTFAPNTDLTRAQFVTMLAKTEGVDTTGYATTQFADVKPGHWYFGAVSWAYEVGLVSGVSETSFSPNAAVSRETISRIMWLYMKDKYSLDIPEVVLDHFTDKGGISAWALDGMKYLVTAGLITGMNETTLAPRNKLTRAQAARILTVFIRDYKYGECNHIFDTVNLCTDAPTCAVCGMKADIPAGHLLRRYNCSNSGECVICKNHVAPSVYIHNWQAATCTTPRKCKDCGAERGTAGKHSFTAATCTSPKTCSICKATEGAPLGHTTKNGICKTCNKEVFMSEAHRAAYYMVTKAIPDGKGHYTYDGLFEHKGGDFGYTGIYYDANKFDYTLEYKYYWGTGGSCLVMHIYIPDITGQYLYNVGYFERDKEICSANGTVKAASVKEGGSVIDFASYSGSNADKNWFDGVCELAMVNCCKYSDVLLYNLCKSGISALGFTNIKY